MTARPRARALSWVRVALWLVVPGATAWIAYTHRAAIGQGLQVLRGIDVRWVLLAVLVVGVLYVWRAFVYRVPLRLLGYSARLSFLWSTAITASTLQQVLPAGPATGYAFLTYAMHQRGVPAGRASLIAILDTLSYAFAVGTLVVTSLVWLGATGNLRIAAFRTLFIAGVVFLGVGAWIYWLQREPRRLTHVVLPLGRRVVTWLGRPWREEPVREYLDEFYRGKALIQRRPRAFIRMLALQYAAVCCDGAVLYTSFAALGAWPHVWIVLLGFVIAMGGASAIGVPGGGGSFETLMAAFFVTEGIPAADAIAATLLFRLLSFWLPLIVAALVIVRLRRRRRAIRRDADAV